MNFLKCNPETWFNRKEIAKKAGGRRLYEENNHWCSPALQSLLEHELIERNDTGHYKFSKEH